MQSLEQKVAQAWTPDPGSHVIAAVSGGADSVFMLRILSRMRKQLGCTLSAAHLDHGLRGREARLDAAFVSDLCRELDLECTVSRRRVRALAEQKGLSLEMAGREARYAFFNRIARKKAGACGQPVVVATAHTQDDQAETLLLNLCRGTGPAGLRGIPPQTAHHGTTVIRPVLSCRRQEIETWLRGHGYAWREDASNRDDRFMRNRVRAEVLPLLRDRLNPKVREALARTAELQYDEETWLRELTAADYPEITRGKNAGRDVLDTAGLRDRPPALRRRLLRHWLLASGLPHESLAREPFSRLDALSIRHLQGTRHIPLAGGWRAVRQYGELRLERDSACCRDAQPFRTKLRRPGETLIPDAGLRFYAERATAINRSRKNRPGALPDTATLSADRVGRASLYVRNWRHGDRIRPYGLKGKSRKLQDIFTDLKVPRDLRSRVPVVECRGEIVWVPGYRIAHGWHVTSESGPMLSLAAEYL